MQWRGQLLKNGRENCYFQCKSALQNTENSRKHDISKGSKQSSSNQSSRREDTQFTPQRIQNSSLKITQ